MATFQALTTFIVWAPDCTDAGAPERRLAAHPNHSEYARRLRSDGVIRAGGPVLTADSANAAPADRKSCGSFKIIEAENLEAARTLVENDVYYTAGVWDKEKIQVLPLVLKAPLQPMHS